MNMALAFNKSLPGLCTLDSYKKYFAEFNDWLKNAFEHQTVGSLVKARARFIDEVLVSLWQHFDLHTHKKISLIAVGGYGRGELHPCSDIDLLLLTDSKLDTQQKEQISQFITLLWDLRLEVGHSVRSVKESVDSWQRRHHHCHQPDGNALANRQQRVV